MFLVGKKKYQIARDNYKVAMEGQSRIRQEFIKFQQETAEKEKRRVEAYNQMEDNCKQLCNRLEFMEEKEKDYKKEIKRLKMLLTRNNISYKKKEEE